MSWNDRLYVYAQERGGQFLGSMTGNWTEGEFGLDGELLLEYRDQPMVVRCDTYHTRHSYSNTARVMLCCELERDYSLSISDKSTMNKGINAVVGGLSAGKQKYDFPEVTGDRRIKTNDPEFTRMVLRDLELRKVLLDNPRFQLQIRRCAPGCVEDPRHLILAKCVIDGAMVAGPDEWDIADIETGYPSPEEELAAMKRGNFKEKLDALIQLAQAAHGAVTSWRMPVKSGKKD